MTEYTVASEGDLDDGEHLVVELEGREIAVFHVGGEYYAYRNWCPHQGGPVCEGPLTGTQESSFDREHLELEVRQTHEDRILNCPWHGWEFDVDTGESLSPRKARLSSYEVTVVDGEIVVTV